MKRKMKHWITMFHFLKRLIINELTHKSETWNILYKYTLYVYARVREIIENEQYPFIGMNDRTHPTLLLYYKQFIIQGAEEI